MPEAECLNEAAAREWEWESEIRISQVQARVVPAPSGRCCLVDLGGLPLARWPGAKLSWTRLCKRGRDAGRPPPLGLEHDLVKRDRLRFQGFVRS